MNNRRPSLIPSIVVGSLFGVAGIICLILGAIEQDTDTATIFYVFGGILLIAGAYLGIFALMMKHQRATQDANFSNPDSIANKVMGADSKFVHFVIIPNSDSQTASNVATNIAGIASAALLGVGFIKWGKKSLDAFVSEDELIINTANSANFDDSNFTCYKSEEVQAVNFKSLSSRERVTIILTNHRGMCFDINTSDCSSQYIREKFGNLYKTPAQDENIFAEFD